MILQTLIAAMSLAATYLSLHPKQERRRFACFFGIAVQPLWMLSTIPTHQWGMTLLSVVYGGIYLHSLWQCWIKRRTNL